MGTVLQQNGFNFKINTDDHEPAHVHIWYQGRVLVVNFLDVVIIRNNYGFNRNEARRAVSIVEENQKLLLEKWKEIHENE